DMGRPRPIQREDHRASSGVYPRALVRGVRTSPDRVLARRAMEGDPYADNVVEIGLALVGTMYASPSCVGLAAPQIGEAVRVFCMDLTTHKKARSCVGLVVMVNPVVVSRSGNVVMREGCMSLPHLTGDVARAAKVTVEGFEPGT